MNKNYLLYIFTGIVIVLFSCNQFKNDHAQEQVNSVPRPQPSAVDIPISALATDKDYVCGMTVEGGQIADTADYLGNIYGFCSKECKAEFIKSPEAYLTQK